MSQSAPFYALICGISSCKTRQITRWNDANHFSFNYQQHHRL